MTTITCYPAYLHPKRRLNFLRCTVVPGVELVRLTDALKETINSQYDRLSVSPPDFGITHAVFIDKAAYLNALEVRLRDEQATLPAHPFIDVESLARQAILSLLLAGRVSFAFQHVHSLGVTAIGQRKSYKAGGWARGQLHQISTPMEVALLQGTGTWPPINPRKVTRIAIKLDRYFRSGMWWSDRLAMAIGYFWNALCTPFSEQAFLSLTTALESLLSTQPMEITHILAERAAVLVAREPSSRLMTYRKVKDLYKVRSQVVHAKVFPKGGRRGGWESLIIDAKKSNVPISSLKSLVDLTLSVIMGVLANRELLRIIQAKKSEQKISKDLDEYFARSLFQGRKGG